MTNAAYGAKAATPNIGCVLRDGYEIEMISSS